MAACAVCGPAAPRGRCAEPLCRSAYVGDVSAAGAAAAAGRAAGERQALRWERSRRGWEQLRGSDLLRPRRRRCGDEALRRARASPKRLGPVRIAGVIRRGTSVSSADGPVSGVAAAQAVAVPRAQAGRHASAGGVPLEGRRQERRWQERRWQEERLVARTPRCCGELCRSGSLQNRVFMDGLQVLSSSGADGEVREAEKPRSCGKKTGSPEGLPVRSSELRKFRRGGS